MSSKITINVKFTGICVFVEHQGGATVVIPNARAIKGVAYGSEHAHVASHLPFLEYAEIVGKPTPTIPPSLIAFSYRYDGNNFNVMELGANLSGVELVFEPANKGGGIFTPTPPILNWNTVIDMDLVLGQGHPIDRTLVSGFDPRSDRVAVRMPIGHGRIEPVLQSDVYSAFLPAAENLYLGQFVQEVLWQVTYEGDLHCKLRMRPLGGPGPGDMIADFYGHADDVFEITIGNVPIQDIIRLASGARGVVDHHFAAYYDLLAAMPPVMRLPHRVSEKKHGSRTGGENCPPAKLSLR